MRVPRSSDAAPPISGPGANTGTDPFSDRFNVLPGGVNGDGAVMISDVILVCNEISPGGYLIRDDVDIVDSNGVRKRLGTHVP